MSTDRDEMLGELPQGTIMWCLHCERVYPYGKYRTIQLDTDEDSLQMCPYEDCDGDAVLDAKEWDWVRESHPQYPEEPKSGILYPLD